MNAEISAATADVKRAKEQLLRSFAKTPDDRLRWSPSATARTPLHLMAHSAFALGFIAELVRGTSHPVKSTEEADAAFLTEEKAVESREQVLSLLDSNCAKFVAAVESLTPEQLEEMVPHPFGAGTMQRREAVKAGAGHTRYHTAQLDYLQTIYGDRTW